MEPILTTETAAIKDDLLHLIACAGILEQSLWRPGTE
jgi:hypothetical protein